MWVERRVIGEVKIYLGMIFFFLGVGLYWGLDFWVGRWVLGSRGGLIGRYMYGFRDLRVYCWILCLVMVGLGFRDVIF